MRVVYLHGFASSPQSSKARYFGARFRERGFPFEAPALDRGDFEGLTISGQLEVIAEAVERGGDSGEVVLMGSSLGGYLAALFASRHPDKAGRLILMAPAFHFQERWKARLNAEELAKWTRQGWAPIFHYGTGTERRLGYQFLEDGLRYPAVPDFTQPALILHGTRDTVVSAQESQDFVREHPAARLVLFETGHELTDRLDEMWQEVAAFLELGFTK